MVAVARSGLLCGLCGVQVHAQCCPRLLCYGFDIGLETTAALCCHAVVLSGVPLYKNSWRIQAVQSNGIMLCRLTGTVCQMTEGSPLKALLGALDDIMTVYFRAICTFVNSCLLYTSDAADE